MLSTNGFLIPLKKFASALGATAYKDFRKRYQLVEEKQLGNITHDAIGLVPKDGVSYIRLPQSILGSVRKLMDVEVSLPQIPPQLDNKQVEFTGELSPCQTLVVDRIMKRFTPERIADGTASLYLKMKAGYGKTFVLIGIIARLLLNYDLRTLVVVPNGEAARQLIGDVKDSFEGLTVGLYNGPTLNAKGGKNTQWDVTVVVINTAIIMPENVLKRYHFCAIDEAHSYTKTYSKVFHYAFPIRLGMSATPDETPSAWPGLKSLEPVVDVLSIPGFKYDEVQYDGVALIIEYWASGGVSHPTNAAGVVDCKSVYNQLIADDDRMKLAAQHAMNLVKKGSPTFVMAEEVDHLEKFRDKFNELYPGHTVKLGMFIGGISDADSKFCREEADILLTTHALCTKAISIPRMTSIISLTPRKASIVQRIGRIYRRGGPTDKVRCIIDILDMKTCFKKQIAERIPGYEYYGMKIVRKTKNTSANLYYDD